MAFCTTCGTQIDERAAFCMKCGKPTGLNPVPTSIQPMSPPPSRSASKAVLLVVGGLFILAILAIVGSLIIGMRIAKHTKVEESESHTTVTTPFGTVQTSKDPEEIARNLGVEVYPGSTPDSDGASVNFAGFNIASAKFRSDDKPDRILAHYRKLYPQANYKSSNGGEELVVRNTRGLISIKVQPSAEGSRFEIANIGGASETNTQENRSPN